ncbi:MAG: hypothetical protein HY006_04220 [Candidatus Sungbacteria bacterium]|nr:hypothetical protein [Candidatus Sungbacteria bacterium]
MERTKNSAPPTGDKRATQQPQAPEYGFFIRLVMRLSGGRVQDSRRAIYILLGVAAVFMLASLLFLFGIPGFSAPTHPNLINP